MMGRHSTELSAEGAGRPVPLSDLSWCRRQSRLPDPPKKKKKKVAQNGGWTRPLLPSSSNWATSSTGQPKVVKVSGRGLQMTLGSGPRSWSSSREATSGLLARALGLGLADYSYLLV